MRILLTNEPRYWETPAKPPKTKGLEFRVRRAHHYFSNLVLHHKTEKPTFRFASIREQVVEGDL